MAWKCSAASNEALIDNLLEANIIQHERVVEAMKAVDRKDFCPRFSYDDSPLSIGYGATISAPHMHGYALESMEPYLRPGMKALDIGSGSGYLSACMAHMVGPSGKVIGIDHILPLVDASRRNVQKNHNDWQASGRLILTVGDGREGYATEAPYDCIHVGAAAPTTPKALLAQLNSPGRYLCDLISSDCGNPGKDSPKSHSRLFIPVGTEEQCIMLYDKDEEGVISEKRWLDVNYVPLTDARQQRFYG